MEIQQEIVDYISKKFRNTPNFWYMVLANTNDIELVKLFKFLVVPFGVKVHINKKYNSYNGDWKKVIDDSIEDPDKRNVMLRYTTEFDSGEIIRSRSAWKHFNENYYSFRGQYRPSEAGKQFIMAEIAIMEEQRIHSYRYHDTETSIIINGLSGNDIFKLSEKEFFELKRDANLSYEADKYLTEEYETKNKRRFY